MQLNIEPQTPQAYSLSFWKIVTSYYTYAIRWQKPWESLIGRLIHIGRWLSGWSPRWMKIMSYMTQCLIRSLGFHAVPQLIVWYDSTLLVQSLLWVDGTEAATKTMELRSKSKRCKTETEINTTKTLAFNESSPIYCTQQPLLKTI